MMIGHRQWWLGLLLAGLIALPLSSTSASAASGQASRAAEQSDTVRLSPKRSGARKRLRGFPHVLGKARRQGRRIRVHVNPRRGLRLVIPRVGTIRARRGTFKRRGMLVVRRVQARVQKGLRSALRPAGAGIDVKLVRTKLRRPLTVAYRVRRKPRGFKPRYMHITDAGSWAVEAGARLRRGKWLVVRTRFFSSIVPSWLQPGVWRDKLKSWARSAGRWAARAIGGRTDPLANCGAPPPGWFNYSQGSDLVHTCTIDNAGRAEIQIKSNRGVAMVVTVPGDPAYVWVEGRPGWVRNMQASLWSDPDREVLLGPGERMTVGYTHPISAFQGDFLINLDDPRAWLDSLIRGTGDLVGDTPAAALITYTMTRCFTGLELGLSTARLSAGASIKKAGCMFQALLGLAEDPERALQIVAEFGGNSGDAANLLKKARSLSLFAKALGVLGPVKDLALRAIDDSMRALLNDGNARITIRLAAAMTSGEPQEPEPPPDKEPDNPVLVGTASSPLDWSVPEHAPHGQGGPRRFGNWIVDVSCPGASLCVGIDDAGNALVSTKPQVGEWDVIAVDPQLHAYHRMCPVATICLTLPVGSVSVPRAKSGLTDISCPSAQLCGAVDAYGNVVWSTDPEMAASWQVESISERWLNAIDCPAAQLCLAGDNTGRVLATTDPAGGAGTWSEVHRLDDPNGNDHIRAISCPSTSRCYVADEVSYIGTTATRIWTATTPGIGNPSSWTQVASVGRPLLGLSCPTESLCVADDAVGKVLSSGSPAAPGSWDLTWVTHVDGTIGSYWPPGGGISCTAGGFCAFGGASFDIWLSSDPLSGDWEKINGVTFNSNVVTAVACRPPSECVAADSNGGVLSSTAPATDWSPYFVDPFLGFNTVSCGSANSCVAIDAGGAATVASGVSGPGRQWDTDDVYDNQYAVALSCVGSELCVSVTEEGKVAVSDQPGAGGWSSHEIADVREMRDVSCPSLDLCVAVGEYETERGLIGAVYTNTDPTSAGSTWRIAPVFGTVALMEVSCPTAQECVATDEFNNVISSSAPDEAAWSEPSQLDLYGRVADLACPSSDLCIALDSAGYVLSTDQPLGTAAEWSAPSGISGGASLSSLACSGLLCVAVTGDGRVQASDNPAAGTAAWSPPTVTDEAGGVAAVSCFSEEGCLSVGRNGRVIWGALE